MKLSDMTSNILFNGRAEPEIAGIDFCLISGWVRADADASFHIEFAGRMIEAHRQQRPFLPPKEHVGFFGFIVPSDHALSDTAPLTIYIDGKPVETITMTVSPQARELATTFRKRKEEKAELLARILKPSFPTGRTPRGTQICFPQGWDLDPSLNSKTDDISAHPIPGPILEQLQENPNRLFLDIGSGMKRSTRTQVVNAEIFDYPSVDVLCDALELPFKDEAFDVVFHSAVFEHVRNPFQAAAESLRVLKPGGIIYSSIPFLHAEHGYPSHYFNATREGHKALYGDQIEVEKLSVPDSSHPWFIVTRSLALYRSALPPRLRKKFNELTVGDVIDVPFGERVKQDICRMYDPEKKFILAAATQLVGRKKG
jgi:SAM-dependent methyltransferase